MCERERGFFCCDFLSHSSLFGEIFHLTGTAGCVYIKVVFIKNLLLVLQVFVNKNLSHFVLKIFHGGPQYHSKKKFTVGHHLLSQCKLVSKTKKEQIAHQLFITLVQAITTHIDENQLSLFLSTTCLASKLKMLN